MSVFSFKFFLLWQNVMKSDSRSCEKLEKKSQDFYGV